VGFQNYIYSFTDRTMLQSYRNNLLWLVLGTGLSVGFGLLIAILADRCKFEKAAKTFIFMPMAVSFVGAGVIWKYVYAYKPPGQPQIGLLNAVVAAFGGDPVGWITLRPWNTLLLIAILVWLQAGFAMVILSAAVKGVPKEIIEAGRVDGANELRVVFSIVIPYIAGSIVTVSTTILIITLKIWDIVFTMTNGLYGTEVLASQQYKQIFKFHHFGRGSAISIILLIAVIPVMWYNLRQFGKREVF
jgi:alpha-glucoside transport system permease protein